MMRIFRALTDRRLTTSSARRLAMRSCHSLRIEPLERRDLLALTSPFDLSQFEFDSSEYDSDSILVRFDSESSAAEGGALLAGSRLSDPLPLLPGLREISLPATVTVEDAIAIYQAESSVVYAEPNFEFRLDNTPVYPDDPGFADTWGLHNTGQSGGTIDADIDAPEAWGITTGSSSVVVAVIDSGVDWDHPDLAANIWSNENEVVDGVDNDHNGYIDDVRGWDFYNHDNDPSDDNSHGTHIAGTIAALGDNATGVAGIAWNAQIMPLKILGSDNVGSVFDAVEALNYAVAMGATVSNNSYGGMVSTAFYDAISAANDAGHVFVTSAGNDNQDNDTIAHYPSSYDLDNIIAVAATDRNDNKASWSNYGATSVDLAAPGVSIYSTWNDGTYDWKQGTSMAAPHVTGTVALVQSLRPDWSATEVVDSVLGSVDPITALSGKVKTGGRLNAHGAVQDAYTAGPEIYVSLDGENILNSTGAVDFGATVIDYPVSYTFTVTNLGGYPGASPLTLGAFTSVPAGFSVTSGFGDTSLDSGESTTFTLELTATAGGDFSGDLAFVTNDADEDPFEFGVSGNVEATPVQILDDSDAGFSTLGSWSSYTSTGAYNDTRTSRTAGGTGQNKATWTFTVSPGWYEVATTWVPVSYYTDNAPYTVFDDTTSLGTTRVSQRVSPDDFTDDGALWEALDVFEITSSTLKVVVSDDANPNFVMADAVRIEKLVLPTISALLATPTPPGDPNDITLTADRVYAEGSIDCVKFFRGAEVLGIDEDGSDGWSWTGSSAGWSLGQQDFSAEALDDQGLWSNTATTSVAFLEGDGADNTIVCTTGVEHTVTIDGGTPYTFDPAVVKMIRIDGNGGDDRINIYGGDGKDVLAVEPGLATMDWGGDFVTDLAAVNVPNVYAYGTVADGDTATLAGSSADDRIRGKETFTKLEDVTGTYLFYAQNFDSVTADGISGADIAYLYGSTNSDTLTGTLASTATPGSATMARATSTTSTAINMPTIFAYAESGGSDYDTATLNGTPELERFYGYKTYGKLVSVGGATTYVLQAKDFAETTGVSGGGDDTVYLYGEAGDDNESLTVFPGWSSLTRTDSSGSTFSNAQDYFNVRAYAGPTGTTEATLYGSGGTETFYGTETYGLMTDTTGYYFRAESFGTVTGVAGDDLGVARLYGTDANDDTLAIEPYAANMSRTGSTTSVAQGFSTVYGYALTGDNDQATLTGTDGSDKFIGFSGYSKMVNVGGTAYFHKASNFDLVTGLSGGGTDDAFLYGGVGTVDDTLSATSTSATLTRTEGTDTTENTATGFANVYGYARPGGTDEATLYGAGGTEVFLGAETYGSMQEAGEYYLRAVSFDTVTGITAGTSATAELYGTSANDDTLTIEPDLATIARDNSTTSVAQGFKTVYGYALTGDDDQATLTGTADSDKFSGYPSYSKMENITGSNYFHWAKGFDLVTGVSGGGSDDGYLFGANGAVDDVLTSSAASVSLARAGATDTVEQFTNVYAYAKPGGTDTATMTGSGDADAFYGYPTYGKMQRTTPTPYLHRANNFSQYTVDGNGGNDAAYIYDSANADTFDFTRTAASMTLRPTAGIVDFLLSEFPAIRVFATSGTGDQANMEGTTGAETFFGRGGLGIFDGTGFYNQVLDVDSVFADTGDDEPNNDILNIDGSLTYGFSDDGTW